MFMYSLKNKSLSEKLNATLLKIAKDKTMFRINSTNKDIGNLFFCSEHELLVTSLTVWMNRFVFVSPH